MNISRNWQGDYTIKAANLSFALLYPLPFFYNFLTISGSIPQYEISSHIVKILFVFFFYLLILKFSISARHSTYFLWVIGFLIFTSIWTAINSFRAPPGTVWQSGAVIIAWLSIFSVGMFFDENRRGMKIFLRVSSISIIAMVFYLKEGVAFVPANIFDVDEGATYQAFSLWAAITFIFTISTINKPILKYISFCFMMAALFFLSARSEMVGFMLAFFVAEASRMFGKLKLFFVYSSIAITFAIFVYFYTDDIVEYINMELYLSRQLNIFDLEADNSWFVRGLYSDFAWDSIRSSPIIGDFGSHYYADRDFPLGAYAHNFMSAWVNYGIIGVSMYMFITIWALFASFVFVFRGRFDDYWISLFMNAFGFILILVSKPVFWPAVALGWGVFARAQIRRNASKAVHS